MQTPDEILRRWGEVCEAATKGPWEHRTYGGADGRTEGVLRRVGVRKGFVGIIHSNDGEFLALSRHALPRAIAALEQLIGEFRYVRDYERVVPYDWYGQRLDKVTRLLNGETE